MKRNALHVIEQMAGLDTSDFIVPSVAVYHCQSTQFCIQSYLNTVVTKILQCVLSSMKNTTFKLQIGYKQIANKEHFLYNNSTMSMNLVYILKDSRTCRILVH